VFCGSIGRVGLDRSAGPPRIESVCDIDCGIDRGISAGSGLCAGLIIAGAVATPGSASTLLEGAKEGAIDGGCNLAVAVFEAMFEDVLSSSGRTSLLLGRTEARGWENGELGRLVGPLGSVLGKLLVLGKSLGMFGRLVGSVGDPNGGESSDRRPEGKRSVGGRAEEFALSSLVGGMFGRGEVDVDVLGSSPDVDIIGIGSRNGGGSARVAAARF